MKKSIKLLSLCLVLSLVMILSFALVACNKDKLETVAISGDELETVLEEISSNTSNAKDFTITMTGEDTCTYSVMAVENKSALMGTNPDGEKIFIGAMYIDKEENIKGETALYYFNDDSWIQDKSIESEAIAIQELGCFEVIDMIERAMNDLENLEVKLNANKKNKVITSYDCTISDGENSLEFSTQDYNGKQVIIFAKAELKGEATEYKYEYGTTFEIPEM